jgi:hypothetical protein
VRTAKRQRKAISRAETIDPREHRRGASLPLGSRAPVAWVYRIVRGSMPSPHPKKIQLESILVSRTPSMACIRIETRALQAIKYRCAHPSRRSSRSPDAGAPDTCPGTV